MTCTIVTVERQLGAALKVKAPLAKLPEPSGRRGRRSIGSCVSRPSTRFCWKPRLQFFGRIFRMAWAHDASSCERGTSLLLDALGASLKR